MVVLEDYERSALEAKRRKALPISVGILEPVPVREIGRRAQVNDGREPGPFDSERKTAGVVIIELDVTATVEDLVLLKNHARLPIPKAERLSKRIHRVQSGNAAIHLSLVDIARTLWSRGCGAIHKQRADEKNSCANNQKIG